MRRTPGTQEMRRMLRAHARRVAQDEVWLDGRTWALQTAAHGLEVIVRRLTR
jgi:hypothetical protein